ncbi:mycofactocin precursor MftA [Parafrankia sp. EUN1f]|uniref:mycofactocin precursor MftA n=1 Tax=Parafrankia sp. EUN1f TaxID=102897 RepID=UPI0001C43AC0|nr:mycofactocin precursor MftA [Parafrankia sp. EUN1f]EFC83046.1 hypothetical protein FrEUN1fDRAFT_3808 [Parafrankia sp. EUN1f]
MRRPSTQVEAEQVGTTGPGVPTGPAAQIHHVHGAEAPLVEDTLIEEVSIDGMCGVY